MSINKYTLLKCSVFHLIEVCVLVCVCVCVRACVCVCVCLCTSVLRTWLCRCFCQKLSLSLFSPPCSLALILPLFAALSC